MSVAYANKYETFAGDNEPGIVRIAFTHQSAKGEAPVVADVAMLRRNALALADTIVRLYGPKSE